MCWFSDRRAHRLALLSFRELNDLAITATTMVANIGVFQHVIYLCYGELLTQSRLHCQIAWQFVNVNVIMLGG